LNYTPIFLGLNIKVNVKDEFLNMVDQLMLNILEDAYS